MDPDLDPNLQHWQDRLDSYQWVVGSLVGTARQHPDLTPLRPAGRALVILAVLTFDGVLSAVGGGLLPSALHRIGALSDQRADQRPGERRPGVGGTAVDVDAAARRAAAVGVAADRRSC